MHNQKIIVGRPVNGITLNGELEFLLDDSGEVKVFNSKKEAQSFLIDAGVDQEELRHMGFKAYEEVFHANSSCSTRAQAGSTGDR